MSADRVVFAGASPDNQLLSHPLALDSPASEDAHSAGHLTSSEPSQASSFTVQAPAQVPSVALENLRDASAPNAVPSIASWIPRDAAAPGAVLNDASLAPEKVDAPDAAAQRTATANQQQQQQQQPKRTQLLPLLLSEHCKVEAGLSSLHSPALQLPKGTAACSPTMQLPTEAAPHSPVMQLPEGVKLADTLHGGSPARDEYDPERYKSYALSMDADLSLASQPVHQTDAQTQPFDTQPLSTQLSEYAQAFSAEQHLCSMECHDAQTLSAQSQTQLTQTQGQAEADSHSQGQTQPVGQSPKQAALHRLRSMSVKQSQTIKAEGAPQPLPERQTGHDAGRQRAGATIGMLHEWQTIHETEKIVRTEPAVGKGGKGVKAPPLLLSPRRSCSVAKLRSQSLAKQLQDPRYASMRRLPLVPISATGIDGSQQSIAGEAGCHMTSKTSADAREGSMLESSTANPFAEKLDKPAIAELAGRFVTPQEEGEASRASRLSHRPTAQAAAATNLAADRAGAGQPCPTHEAAVVQLDDVNVVLDTQSSTQRSAMASMLSWEPQDDPSLSPPESSKLLARSTDNLNLRLCSHTGTGNAPESTQELSQSSSKSEGASPARLSSNSDSSLVLDHHPHLYQDSFRSACSQDVDGSSMQEISSRQAGSDSCAVAVCIRSSGTGATVSLEIQELSAQDSQAKTAAAMTHAVVSSASKLEEGATPQTGLFPAVAEGKRPDNVQPSNPAQPCQAAAAAAEVCLREEGRNGQQAAAALTDGWADAAELPEAAHSSEHEPREVSSSPGKVAQRAASSSPGRRGSPGQGLLGRLEGGLRNWLGRGSKQMVGKFPLFVNCLESVSIALCYI